MDGDFALKLRAAARAAWLTGLVGWVFVFVSWLAYLALSAGWFDGLISLGLYGPMTRERIVPVVFWFIGGFKMLVFCIFLGAIYLSLWSRALRRAA